MGYVNPERILYTGAPRTRPYTEAVQTSPNHHTLLLTK
jgi:hypothetical protein